MTDVVLNKIQSIQRCVKRARDEYNQAPSTFEIDFTRQDAALLNVLRACEQAIDLANHIIRTRSLGVPTTTADGFDLLTQENVIDRSLADRLKKMVQFRFILVHQYQRIEFQYVKEAIEVGLDDLVRFGDRVRQSS